MNARARLAPNALSGYEPEIGAALWQLQDARRRTLKLLDGTPDEHLDAQVNDNTIGTILYHLALIETDWLYSEILEAPYPEHFAELLPADDRDAQGVLSVVKGQSLEEHLGRLAAVREALLKSLQGMSSEEFQRVRSLPDYDVSPPWVLHHLAQHEAEHRGEVGAILTWVRRGQPA